MGQPETYNPARAWQPAFLEAFAERGNVSAGCRAAGIARQTYYDCLEVDDDFKQAVAAAREEACDVLEDQLWRLGVEGIEGKRRYEVTALLRLLEAHRPERFSRRYDMNHRLGTPPKTEPRRHGDG